MFDIARLFNNVERYEVEHGDNVIIFPAELTKSQKNVLELLEVSSSLYLRSSQKGYYNGQ